MCVAADRSHLGGLLRAEPVVRSLRMPLSPRRAAGGGLRRLSWSKLFSQCMALIVAGCFCVAAVRPHGADVT